MLCQAVAYFLDANRMGNPSYINRFIDILRSPLGRPLLNQLAASSDKLAALLYFPLAPANPAEAPPPPVSTSTIQRHVTPSCALLCVPCHANMQHLISGGRKSMWDSHASIVLGMQRVFTPVTAMHGLTVYCCVVSTCSACGW